MIEACEVAIKPYYQDDAVTIYHGDCREILPTLPKHDLLLTDPPYEIEGTWDGGNSHGWGKLSAEAKSWDVRPSWFCDLVPGLAKELIIWGGQYFPLEPSGSWLIWDKVVRKFSSGHAELAWTNLGMPVRAFNCATCLLANEGKSHPTQKPLALFRWCLSFAPDAVTILDLFAGSCTTGVAAKLEGRKATLIEMEERYCEIGAKRLSQGVLF